MTDAPTLLTVTIPQTPHTTLRPNDRTDERTKARHRKVLRQAATLALKNVLVSRPELAQELAHHRLRLDYLVMWEKSYGGRRNRWDRDSLIVGLKAATDGLVDAINFHLDADGQINDRDIDFAPVVQEFPEYSQGEIVVQIISLGEIVRAVVVPEVVWRCQAITRKGTQCSRRALQEFHRDGAAVHICALHCHVLAAGGAFELEALVAA